MGSVDHSIKENIKPYEASFGAMVPTPFVKFMRTCLIWQGIRFIIINVKMILVVQKSH
ncbi:MAG: hypothetical protein LGB07_03600 [Sulfurovum sp.]|nr:hypothetical protein [Sulfurovum sp.]MCB4744723.1 hypothetical protein [Sulfurovum sp.]MCB4746808.1 hypothetical protein [Sulfurovum sp.]MCB4747479.1 hypothetical protein [Sulfurovum sp.]MCB4749529.1 hypothetical protein [Sulfurovum sp.]